MCSHFGDPLPHRWIEASIGAVTSVLAEAVDFYPTLAALAGLPTPESAGQQINGTSLLPAFEDPEGSSGLKEAAFSQFAKPDCHFRESVLDIPTLKPQP